MLGYMGEWRIQLQAFLTPALDEWRERSGQLRVQLSLFHGIHWTLKWVSPRASLDQASRRTLAPGRNRTPHVQSVTSHRNHWAIPAHSRTCGKFHLIPQLLFAFMISYWKCDEEIDLQIRCEEKLTKHQHADLNSHMDIILSNYWNGLLSTI
jgi:hypothetical protein